MNFCRWLSSTLLALGLVATLAPRVARADDGDFAWDISLKVESDMRFRLSEERVGDWYGYKKLVAGVERNQNTLGAKLNASLDKFKAVANLEFVVFGYRQEIDAIGKLSEIEETQPYRFDLNELYLEADDFIVDGLDLRLGQQVVSWGVGDQFNPTNNLNPDDLRDPLLFGKQAGNFMLRADFWVTEDFSWQGVLVPFFRPALLPESAALGPFAIDRLPFVDDALRWRLTAERGAAQSFLGHPTIVDGTKVELPDPAFENMQAGFRIGGTVFEQDWSLSYYNGRTDFPVAKANHTRQDPTFSRCNASDPSDCADGLLRTDVTLHYPRMHVYGLNLSGEFNPFKWIDEEINGIGYRAEVAFVVPVAAGLKITQDPLTFPKVPIGNQPGGEYDYDNDGVPGGKLPEVVTNHPFLKWTVGLDYTFGSHLYVNLQWVHGLADEYGAGDWIWDGVAVRKSRAIRSGPELALTCALPRDGTTCASEITRPRLGDFLVAGVDVRFLDDAALARLFTIFELSGYTHTYFDSSQSKRIEEWYSLFTPEGFSAAIYPELQYNFGNGFEASAGALFLLGRRYTKFGDPASGGSLAFLRARYTL